MDAQSLPKNAAPSSTLSESGSSFSLLATVHSSPDPFEVFDESSSEDDIVVWTGNEFDSDEDFILIPHAHSHSHTHSSALKGMTQLSLEPVRVVSEKGAPAPSPAVTPTATPTTSRRCQNSINPKTSSVSKSRKAAGPRSAAGHKPTLIAVSNPSPPSLEKTRRSRRRRGQNDVTDSFHSLDASSPHKGLQKKITSPVKEKAAARFGSHPIVESDPDSEPMFTKCEDATSFITFFLSNPSAALSSSAYARLTFLQSLIIELGILTTPTTLPSSLTAAKRLLKTRAFINIGEYLTVRKEGVQKVREIMFESKRALASDLKKNKGRRKTDKGWVKRHGLNVLLVSVE